MAGNRGVGKSSLINALVPGTDLRTGKISDIRQTGMQTTTTFSEMITLPDGGEIIDIPAVENHQISESRYASYLSILDELRDPTKYRKPY